jgi:hypothetical protein
MLRRQFGRRAVLRKGFGVGFVPEEQVPTLESCLRGWTQ